MTTRDWGDGMAWISNLKILCLGGFALYQIGFAMSGQAQTQPIAGSEFNAPPKVLELIEARLATPQITDQTPSPKSLTIPGVWLANRLFGDKMVANWFAYRRTQDSNSQVRLIVRSDLWSRYTTLERYAFLTRFGRSASVAGYHLLVLDRQNFPLGAHTCQFPPQKKPYPLYPWIQGVPSLPTNAQVACRVWVSPVYGSQLF